jgi:hypothetical protein
MLDHRSGSARTQAADSELIASNTLTMVMTAPLLTRSDEMFLIGTRRRRARLGRLLLRHIDLDARDNVGIAERQLVNRD